MLGYRQLVAAEHRGRNRQDTAMSRRSLLLPIPLQSSRSSRGSPIACAVRHNLLNEILAGFARLQWLVIASVGRRRECRPHCAQR